MDLERHDSVDRTDGDDDGDYFASMNPANIGDWDTSLDNPVNSGNPKTAESAFEQGQIEERAVADFEHEQERVDKDVDDQDPVAR
jgi:hypothetical protein